MSGMQALFMNYGPQLLLCDSADFDGSNDYMLRGADLTNSADSKSGIVSVWVRLDGGDGTVMRILVGDTQPYFSFARGSGNGFNMAAWNAAASNILQLNSTSTTYTASATWYHVLMSWDLATAAGHMYINDVNDLGGTTLTNDTINYTVGNWAICRHVNASDLFNGCIAELYFAQGQYLDFSNIYQRRKFISSSGKPVYLGADGSAPTGTAPIVYQRVADAAAVATFATNLGTGGNFTITGTLTDGSTSPSD